MIREAADYADLGKTDLALARVSASLERARASLAHGGADAPDPFLSHRSVSGQRALGILDELAKTSVDPYRARAQARMVTHLTIVRVSFEAEAALARAIAEEAVLVDETPPRVLAWNAAVRALVLAKVAPGMAPVLAAMTARAPGIAAPARRLRETVFEAARRLGLDHPEDPFVAAAGGARPVVEAARVFLHETDPLASEIHARARKRASLATWTPLDALALALGTDAPRGWPARLAPRWFEEILPGFAKRVHVAHDALPEAVGAASFARALGVFGDRLVRSTTSAALPFSMSHDPTSPRALVFSALFGALPSDPAFFVRLLGESAATAKDQARVLARVLLFTTRKAAVEAILCASALTPRELPAELSERLFGAELPARLAGAWPPFRRDAVSRFEAMLLAHPRRETLVRRFDEDWFRNPRAEAALLAEAAGPARDFDPHPADTLAPLPAAVARWFDGALG